MEDSETFCSNCQRNIAARNFLSHSVHCERRLQLCRLCNEPVPRSEFENHLKDNHILGNCSDCGMVMEIWKIEPHQVEDCLKRLVSCKFCSTNWAFDEIRAHKVICGSRTEKCASCNAFVKLEDKDSHPQICKKDNNIKTLVLCKFCDLEFPPESYPEHEMSCGSRTERCSLCGEYVLLKDQNSHHNTCGRRENQQDDYHNDVFFCQYCELEFPRSFYQDHILMCGDRIEKCSKCYNYVKMREMDRHWEICKQDMLFCQYCELEFPRSFYQDHILMCGDRIEKCSKCYINVKMREMNHHWEICKQESFNKPIFCKYCKLEFSYENYQYHELRCGARVEKCYKCNKFVSISEADHHRNICQKDTHESDNKEGISASKFGIEDAQELDEGQRPIPCSYCNYEFPLDCLADHTETCRERIEDCSVCNKPIMLKNMIPHVEMCKKKSCERLTQCVYCKTNFPLDYVGEHAESCIERIENCSECKMPVMLRDKINHEERCKMKLREKLTPCMHCENSFPLDFVAEHAERCPERFENCSECNMSVMLRDKIKHKESCKMKLSKRPTPCAYCKIKLPPDFVAEHEKKCLERIENCPKCEMPVMLRDKLKHKGNCKMSESSDDVQCPICLLPISHNELELHYNTCIEANSADTFQQLKKSQHVSGQDAMDYTESIMPSSIPKEKEGFCETGMMSCPYCFKTVLGRLIKNHKKYCRMALKECPLCEETFHIEEESAHSQTCGAKKSTEHEESSAVGQKNQHSSPQTENSYREYEKISKVCQYCDNKIPVDSYENHVRLCSKEMKQCPFCQDAYSKENEKIHMENCWQLRHIGHNVYPDSSDPYSTGESGTQSYFKDVEMCPFCKKMLPAGSLSSHMLYCSQIVQCSYCTKKILLKDSKHIERCSEMSQTRNRFSSAGPGAKPKRSSKKQEKEQKTGTFSKLLNYIGFTGANLPTSDSVYSEGASAYHRDTTYPNSAYRRGTTYPNSAYRRGTTYPNSAYPRHQNQPEAEEPIEKTFIPCEFCGKMILLDFHEIAVHESGCRPDLVSLPSAVAENSEVGKPTVGDTAKNRHQWETFSEESESERRFNQRKSSSETKPDLEAVTPPLKKENIENYTFIQNFNAQFMSGKSVASDQVSNEEKLLSAPYAESDDAAGPREKDVRHKKDHLKKKDPLSESYRLSKSGARLKSGEQKNHQSSNSVVSCSDKFIKNGLTTQNYHDDELLREKEETLSDPVKTGSYKQSRKITKPGEFLDSEIQFQQYQRDLDIVSHQSKRIEKHLLATENVVDDISGEEKPDKLYHSWKVLDSENDKLHQRKVCSENIGYEHHEKPESDNQENAYDNNYSKVRSNEETYDNWQQKVSYYNTGNVCLNSELSSVGNNKNKQLNIGFHKGLSGTNETEMEMYDVESLPESEYSIISSSEMKGPVRIDRMSLRKTNIQQNAYVEKDEQKNLSASDGISKKCSANQHDPNLDRFSKYASSSINLKEKEYQQCKKTVKDKIMRISYYQSQEDSKLNQSSECPKSEQQPMETDDQHHLANAKVVKALTTENFYSRLNDLSIIHHNENKGKRAKDMKGLETCRNFRESDNRLSDLSDSENKDSNLDSYYQFLETDRHEDLKNNACKVCGNEMCLCKIKESLSTVRSLSFTEEPENKDFHSPNAEVNQSDDNIGLYKNSGNPKYSQMDGFDNEKQRMKILEETWNKWRETTSDSE